MLKKVRSWWKGLQKRTKIILGSSGLALIVLFVTFFPEPWNSTKQSIYKWAGLDKPSLAFESMILDGMYEWDVTACPPGIYESVRVYSQEPNIKQSHIYFGEYHEFHFEIKSSNQYADGKLKIDKIVLSPLFWYTDKGLNLYTFEECGAGETEKIFTVPEEKLNEILDRGYGFTQLEDIDTVVDPSNKEPFDFITMDAQSDREYFKLKMNLKRFGVLKFKLKIYYSYNEKEYIVESPELFIGNSEQAAEYWKPFADTELELYQRLFGETP